MTDPPARRNECPVGCGRTRAPGQLLCRPCWNEVPADLQRKVYNTWRSWRGDLTNGGLMRDYRTASDAAIASVR